MKYRLEQLVFARGLVPSRSQAESWIKLGKVRVNDVVITKPDHFVDEHATLELTATEQYVSRAALKLTSVARALKLNFRDKVMLDVGSSTGGFTDYALRQGAQKVIAVDIGTNQLHPSLRTNPKVELHEQTDIRNVVPLTRGGAPRGSIIHPARNASEHGEGADGATGPQPVVIQELPDLVVIDVSFISLREILPHIATLCSPQTQIVAMVKPQFEVTAANLKNKGIIKNDRMRRDILKNFEDWVRTRFVVAGKADSDIAGSKGNVERFYLLRLPKRS
jgi:23S rRNA (cytidine1920-2'-O)/16S rRNA (cytidine1409-2'-O)-methyltransferase